MLIQRAFAKINLGLKILRKRSDGYHDIETIFYRIDASDELSVEEDENFSFECDQPELSNDENLVFAAGSMLREALGTTRGAVVRLRKRIPVGAGLGGGSADAAAALRLLCRLWDQTPSEETLAEIALRLGSDVPYFLRAGAAHATSRGERLTWFDLDIPYPILTLTPDLRIRTADAYAMVTPNPREGSDDLRTLLAQHLGLPELLGNVLRNDFQPPVFRRHPLLAELREEFISSGAAFCAMSGSGSSLFAFFTDEPAARGAMERFRGRGTLFYTPPGFRPDLGIREA